MNREILFRGKSANTGEWVEGFCVQFGETYSNIIIREIGKLNLYGVVPIYEHEIVISETVGQYTGLKDKTGRKIFEGDIVRLFNRNGQEIMSYVVEWYSDCSMFVLDCIDFDMEFDTDFTVFYGDEFEIVGNIHDNPELVRKDEENGSSYKSD